MEKILRSEEMAEIVLLPVRHHSPACSFHVKWAIEEYEPSLVLIEGPENAGKLIPVMADPDTQAPFAIYYSYHDKAGLLSEEKEHYKCYYPFLNYSPELVALRTAGDLKIPAAFIDLSYAAILAASKNGQGLRKKEEKNNYNDDYLLSRNAYIQKLCEKSNLRSFDEFWEKYFEISGLSQKSEDWFSSLSLYCTQARDSTPEEILEEDGSLARETHMAETILQIISGKAAPELLFAQNGDTNSPSIAEQLSAAKNAGVPLRVLVITGGFHTPALSALLRDDAFVSSVQKKGKQKTKKVEQDVYLMPYSMEAADALNGYASGMPYPAFYEQIWEKLPDAPQDCYRQTVFDFLVTCGKETRKKEGTVSTYDEICAAQMADGLSLLRGKEQPGAYELLDAVLSSYVKGEYTIATDTPLFLLKKQMTGSAIGKLSGQAAVPPIVQDFEALCRAFSLKTGTTLETEVILSLFSSDRHRNESHFFHRMLFLNTSYARRLRGPNLQRRKDRNLIREIWKYKWSTQVNAALIDVSVYGATIEEAASTLVKEELKKDIGAGACAALLTKVFEMGLNNRLATVYDRAQELIQKDTDFYSLADALSYLKMMRELAPLYQSALDFELLLRLTIRKLITLLPSMAAVKEEDLTKCMNTLKLLYQLTEEQTGRDTSEAGADEMQPPGGYVNIDEQDFYDALFQMQQDPQIQAGLDGCIHGILYGGKKEDTVQIERACLGYFQGTKEQAKKAALFFRGLFFSARDLIFIDGQLLRMLDTFLQQAGALEFMELLPELRMAFTYFTPREIDRIAEKAAALHGISGKDILRLKEVPPDWYAYGQALDADISQVLANKESAFSENTDYDVNADF